MEMNTMTETETKQVSQKADALARYTKGKEAGAISTSDEYILTVPTPPSKILKSPYQFRLDCADTPSWKITLDGTSLELLNNKST